jgi:hypothetical protein
VWFFLASDNSEFIIRPGRQIAHVIFRIGHRMLEIISLGQPQDGARRKSEGRSSKLVFHQAEGRTAAKPNFDPGQ